ncbi:hypothetical protein SLEP1_g17077 [Rubroshorea leprosula]|uniref:Transposase MuDR plant domain-containing protein n=1 Tax=Rubroshorea leprosula TaxID=152421 RepID=A0AAV5J3J2_9ROSI|nr:hypothetical protein SLEP1_g17077 [Rubroshorea leprosula]
MRFLLNERGIIDVYIEHVCDEPNILDLVEDGTIPHEAIDEGTMHLMKVQCIFFGSDEDIGKSYVPQNSQPTPTCNEAPKTTEGDANETDAVHGVVQMMMRFFNLLEIKRNIKPMQKRNADGARPSGTIHETHTTVNEEGERVPVRIDSHGDLCSNSSFESSEDEFEVSSDDSGDYAVVYEDELKEEKGDVKMKFEHMAQFTKAIAKYQIQKGCRLKLVKSDPTKQRIHCVNRQCNWQIFASFDKNDQTFKVKTYCREHTCFRSLKSDMVGSRVLAKHHRNRIFANPQIRISELVRLSHLELGVYVSRDKCQLAKDKIIKKVKETHMNEFAQLRGYAKELLRLSPETIVNIDTDPPTTPKGKPAFKGIYVCLEGCRKGFLLGCRPMIGVDACFLKGMFKGTLLAIVARDGINQIFPIA